jgi:hypothetical protein
VTAGHYHCSVKSVGRASGAGIVAKAAYRAGEQLHDERAGQWTADYGRRARSVLDKLIVVPPKAPAWAYDRNRLWNAAERAEARKNGRIATELELALPYELDPEQRRQLVAAFMRRIVGRYGVAADVAIHTAHDARNIHAHVLLTHRQLGPAGFEEIANRRTITKRIKGREKQIEIAGVAATPGDVEAIRRAWAGAVNAAYAGAGHDVRVDHRSFERRGIEDVPGIHLGAQASAMERRRLGSSERGAFDRAIAEHNAHRRKLRQLRAEARRLTQRPARREDAARAFSSSRTGATPEPLQRRKRGGAADVSRQASTPLGGPARAPWSRFGIAPRPRAPPGAGM